MSGEFKMECELEGRRYVLNRAAAGLLLESLDSFGDACGDPCKRLREDLRKALDGTLTVPGTPNPFDEEAPDGATTNVEEAEVIEETTVEFKITSEEAKAVLHNVAKENAAACGDCRVPRCRFCGEPGERTAGRKDLAGRTVEHYYVCKTAGCIAAKMGAPAPAKIFAGGAVCSNPSPVTSNL